MGHTAEEMSTTISAEQQARDLLERLKHPQAQELSSGDVVELANIIAERDLLKAQAAASATAKTEQARAMSAKTAEFRATEAPNQTTGE